MSAFKSDCEKIVSEIKHSSFFPYASGHLRSNATSGRLIDNNTYDICFSSSIAPYLPYLEEGTAPHDIPFAFVGKKKWIWWYPYKDGVPFLFGMGGRFNGKFHPGSTKHKDFIKEKCVDYFFQSLVNIFLTNSNLCEYITIFFHSISPYVYLIKSFSLDVDIFAKVVI